MTESVTEPTASLMLTALIRGNTPHLLLPDGALWACGRQVQ
ncbi:MAG TPA: hypothetical protein QF882_10510 [Arenicellales bacterium]|nr:hypothetical protein [Arenicellales bacterium]